MKNKKMGLYLLLAAAGAAALFLGKFATYSMKAGMVSGLCYGFGAAFLCLGLGKFFDTLIVSKTQNEEIMRRKNIEVNDERNIRIREKVGAKINQVVIYALSVVIMAMGFMQIHFIAIILVASILLLELVLAVALTAYYSKQM